MSRRRWFDADWHISVAHMASRMQEFVFNAKSDSGFIIDRVRQNFLEAKFVQKISAEESLIDPLGNEFQVSRTEYYQWQFRMQHDSPGLELIDGPRSHQQFLSKLSQLCSFSLSIKEKNIDLMRWYREIIQIAELSAIIDSVQFSQSDLQSGINSRTTIRSKRDLIAEIESRISSEVLRVEKLRLRIDGRYRGTMIIGENLSLILECFLEDDLLVMIRRTIPKVVQSIDM